MLKHFSLIESMPANSVDCGRNKIRRVLVCLILIAIPGCVSLGNKLALVPEQGSEWKRQFFGNARESYVFSCGKISIGVSELVISSHTSAIGFIVPIPVSHDQSFEGRKLKIYAEVIGFPEVETPDPTGSLVSATSKGIPIELLDKHFSIIESTTNNKDNELWVQYGMTFVFNAKLMELDSLRLEFDLPMFKCDLQDLNLKRESIKGNELIISPGP